MQKSGLCGWKRLIVLQLRTASTLVQGVRRTMIITHRTQSLSNLVRQCPRKLRPYWEQTVYVVKQQVSDSPIYKMCSET